MNAAEFPHGWIQSPPSVTVRRLRLDCPAPVRLRGDRSGRRFPLAVPAVPAAAFTEPGGGAVR